MFSYFYSFNLVSASMKMAGTSATVIYNSLRVSPPGELPANSTAPWRTPHVKLKGSDRRPFF